MTLFALIHDPAGDRVSAYTGMDQATVTGLINETGIPFNFIDQPTYVAFVQAHQPVPLTPAQLLAYAHSQAVSNAVSGPDAVSTLQRAAALVIEDRLNIIHAKFAEQAAVVAAAISLADLKTRWAAIAPLPQMTPAQIQTAIVAKINANAAD